MKNILLLYDYRGFFATKFIGTVEHHTGTTMDVENLKKLFEMRGFHVQLCEMSQVDLSKDYLGWYVVYASSEDPGLFFKEYIEDVLLALKNKGAFLIPCFEMFRAHSNKSFQEMLRRSFHNQALVHPAAYSIGEYSELRLLQDKISFPCVIKVSNGAGSKGVRLIYSWDELEKSAKQIMTHQYHDFAKTPVVRVGLFIKRVQRRVLGKRIQKEVLFPKLRTNKIIIEEFIPNLSGDNKVLYFYGKYFVLSRKNRDNDFRASGSGKFSYPNSLDAVQRILDLAECCVKELNMPIMSLDIGANDQGVFLLEYQCVYFGPYTLQYAPHCYKRNGSTWEMSKGSFDLEEEYVRSIEEYIKANE